MRIADIIEEQPFGTIVKVAGSIFTGIGLLGLAFVAAASDDSDDVYAALEFDNDILEVTPTSVETITKETENE